MMRSSRKSRFPVANLMQCRMPTIVLLSLIVSTVSCQEPRTREPLDRFAPGLARGVGEALGPALQSLSEALGAMIMRRGAICMVAAQALYFTEEELLELPGQVFHVGEDFDCDLLDESRAPRLYDIFAFAEEKEFANVARKLPSDRMANLSEDCDAYKSDLRPCNEIDSKDVLGIYLSREDDSDAPLVALLFTVECKDAEHRHFEVRCLSSARIERNDLLLRERRHVNRRTVSPQKR